MIDNDINIELDEIISKLNEIKKSINIKKGGLKFPDNNIRKLILIESKLSGIKKVFLDIRKRET